MNNKNYAKYNNLLKLPSVINYNNTQSVSIAIIMPHRNNIDYLKKFISWIARLEKSSLHIYDLYIIDQNNFDRFNRGLLLNVGFYIAKNADYDRYIFHDIGLYPSQEIFNLYFSELDKNIHFHDGVIGFKYNDFEKINGFPLNSFGHEGGEYDCLFNRSTTTSVKIFKPHTSSYTYDAYQTFENIELNKRKTSNITYDFKNWSKNGIKQLEKYFINYKQYDVDNFMENYSINDSNLVNNAELLYKYKSRHKNNINAFKIDYLAIHDDKYDLLLNNDFIDRRIRAKIQNTKYYQHKTKPIYMSVIKPLIYWDEIKKKIIDTYTKPKQFKLNTITNKYIDKINDILKNEFSAYDKLSVDDLEKTIKFIFENYTELIYIRIRDNKIECSYHIYGETTKVDWFKNLKYKSKPIDKSIINILEDMRRTYYTVKNPHNMSVNNCLLGLDSYNYFEGNPTSYISGFIDMINYTIEQFKEVPDCDLLLNRKDFAYLRKDNKYGYDHILDEKIEKPLKSYWPVGVQSKKKINYEIPIPSADEWEFLKHNTTYETEWEDKKPIAVFRGSSTGCGCTPEHNKRIQLAQLTYDSNHNNKNRKLFNVALSKITRRVKVYNSNINIIDREKYKHLLGSFLDGIEQSKNKYIFNIEGNAQAYRYSTEFSKKSVILSVKSEFYMWFEPLLKNNKHIIEIDLEKDNIEKIVSDLIKNDDDAQKIAKNGYLFYKKYINKNMIAYYWFHYMKYLNNLLI